MKPSEVIVVFMSIPESAGFSGYSNIIEVFFNKNEAEVLASEIRKKVSKNWGFDKKELSDSDNMILQNVVEILTLDKAIEKIEMDIHESYSMDESY